MVLRHVFWLLVSVEYSFSVVDLLAYAIFVDFSVYAIFEVWLFSFNASHFLTIVTSTYQFIWLLVIIVFREKALESWFAFIIVRKFGWGLRFVTLKDLEIFYMNDFFWSLMWSL